MAPIPVTPTNVNPSYPVSGGSGNTTVSGLSPASGFVGASGQFSGPHYIEEQSLTVNYWRVPSYSFNRVQSTDFSLSSASPTDTVVSGNVQKTMVWAKVTATTRAVKSYDRFNTSSYQQPQRFEILSTSADVNGKTYGVVSNGTLGPAGTINTSQKFYLRRPWESSDVEIDYTTQGYTYSFEPIPIYGGWSSTYSPWRTSQSDLVNDVTIEAIDKFPELNWQLEDVRINNAMLEGILYGPYLAANEQTSFVEDVLDFCGNGISNGQYLYNGDLATSSVDYQAAKGRLADFDTSAGGANPYYLTSRHDYS